MGVPLSTASHAGTGPRRPPRFSRLGERLWLDFVNTGDAVRGEQVEQLRDVEDLIVFLEDMGAFDGERAAGFRRRAREQPSGAMAAFLDARRARTALRALAEHGPGAADDALGEINRILGRSAGTRRLEAHADGTFSRSFVPVGDAFAGLVIPIIESAAETLIAGDLARVRRCGDPRCSRVFLDDTRNGRRRWCEMSTCGNRAKAARWRQRQGRRA